MKSSRPERLIYLLDADSRRRLRCEFLLTRLLNWKAFQPAPIKRIQDLMQARFQDYLRDEDRRIVMRLLYWETPDAPVARITGADAHDLLREMIATGRAFARNGGRLRLQWHDERPAQPSWHKDQRDRWLPLLAPEPTGLAIASEPPCYLDPKKNLAGPIASPFSPALAQGWLNAEAMNEEQARPFCLRLMNRFPGEQVPLPGADNAAEIEKIAPDVHLRVFRRDAGQSLEKGRARTVRELALLEVRFAYGPRKIDWNSDAKTVAFEEDGRLRRCARDAVTEEQALSFLRDLGFAQAASAANGLLDFDRAHFELGTDAPSDWPKLLEAEFPRLRREFGWRIAFDLDFHPVPSAKSSWYSRVVQTKNDWFNFETGIRYRGKNVPVLPIVRSLLREHAGPRQTAVQYPLRRS